MTPQELARLEELEAKYAPQTGPSGLGRVGAGFANIGSKLMSGIANTALGATDLLTPGDLPRATEQDFSAYRPVDVSEPRTTGEFLADLPANLASEVIQLAGGGAVRPLIRKAAAPLVTGAVQGLQSGIRQSGTEAGVQAAEFGLGNVIAENIPGPGWARVAGRALLQAAVPFAGQGARAAAGGEFDARQATVQGLAQAALGSRIPEQVKRSYLLRRAGPQYPEAIGPKAPPPDPVPDTLYPDLAPPMRSVDAPAAAPQAADDIETAALEELFGSPQAQGAATTPAPAPATSAPALQPARLVLQPREQRLREQGLRPTALNPADESALFSAPPESYTKGQDIFPDVVEMARRRREAEAGMGVQYKGRMLGRLNDYTDLETGTNFSPKSMFPETVRERALFKREQFKEPAITEESQLDDMLALLRKQDAPEAAVSDSPAISALQRNRKDVQADYDIARAIGDDDAAVQALRQLEVIDQKITQEGGAPPKRMKLKRQREEGVAALPLVSAVARGSLGALTGAAVDEENRARGAAIGAGIGLVGPAAGRRLLRRGGDAALKRQGEAMRDTSGSLRGRVSTLAGRWLNAGRTTELRNATERMKGFEDLLLKPLSRARQAAGDADLEAVRSNPAQSQAIEQFVRQKGTGLDTSALEAAGVPKPVIELARRAREAKVGMQGEKARALSENEVPFEVDPAEWQKLPAAVKRAIVIRDTMGSHQSRVYGIDIDPSSWREDPAAFAATASWIKSRNPSMSDFEVEESLRRYLRDRLEGNAQGFGAGNKLNEALFIHRKDLSDREWEALGALASNPSVPAPLQAILSNASASRTLSPLDQKAVSLLSRNQALGEAERSLAQAVGERTILPPEFRKLLGEATDPLQRELLTVAKLARSAGNARVINELSSYTRDTGLPAVMTTEQWNAARSAGQDVAEYVKLDSDSPNLGKLAGKWVTADVWRHFMEPRKTDPGSLNSLLLKYGVHEPTKISKQAMTVMNPATHMRQALQVPLMMVAGRVNPKTLPRILGTMADRLRNPDDPLWRQMIEDHVLGANFSRQEIQGQAVDFLKKQGIAGKSGKALMKPVNLLRKLYGAPDDVLRIASYLSALERFKGDRLKAMAFMNRFTPNYGQVSRAVDEVRKLPIGAPFLSWTAETLRISKNLADEMLNGKSYKDRVWAMSALGAMLGVGVVASEASKRRLSKNEREEFAKAERLMKTYQRNQAKVVLGRNAAGGRDFISTTNLTPGGDLVAMAQSLLRGDFDSFFSENPIAGIHKNPLISAALDVAQGQHHFTGNKLETAGEKATRLAEAFAPPLAPVGYEGRKLRKLSARGGQYVEPQSGQLDTTDRAIYRNLGINIQSASTPVLLRNARYEAEARLQEAERDYRREVRSGTPQAVAQKTLLRRRQQIAEEYRELIR